MKDKKKNPSFRIGFIILFIIYMTLYISQATGYYDFQQHEKVQLTEDKIKQFENDVKAGKEIDVENYLTNTTKDYSNGVSKTGLKISNSIKKIMKKGIGGTLKFLENLLSS